MLGCTLHHIQCDNHEKSVLFNMHTHDHDELTYYVYGNGSTRIEDEEYPFRKGTFAFYRAGTVHNEDNVEPSRVIWSHFSCNIDGVNLKEGVFEDPNGELYLYIKNLRNAFMQEDMYKSVLVEACLTQVIITAVKLQNRTNSSQLFVNWQKVLDYVDENSNTAIDFSAIAASYNYSYDRFRHLFSEKFGISPHAYLLHHRIERSKLLLKNSDTPITDIAFDCGFNSSSQFSNAFKKEIGITPGQYRMTVVKGAKMGATEEQQ